MADLPKLTSQDREHLRNIGFGSLPDNPAQARYSAKEIKGASTRPNLQLFDWLKSVGDFVGSEEVIHTITSIEQGARYPYGSVLLLSTEGDLQFYRKTQQGYIAIGDSLATLTGKFSNYYTKEETALLIAQMKQELQDNLGLLEITASDVDEIWGNEEIYNYDFNF